MRLLLTRPEADSAPLAAALRARGHECIVSPLMEIAFHPPAKLDLAGVAALLATSSNGVRALLAPPDADKLRALPLFAVGDATARTAREAGFAQVHVAGGDVARLAECVAARLAPGAGRLLHVAGRERAGDLKAALEERGFAVDVVVLYAAAAATGFTPGARAALACGALDAVLLYSPRTARIYAGLVAAADLSEAARAVHHLCLSRAVAEALAPLDLAAGKVHVAARPEQAALVALLGRIGAAG